MTTSASLVTGVATELLLEAEAALESLPATLTAATAPSDVAVWLRDVGRRPFGTKAALETLLEERYGVPVEILDPGGTTWSLTPAAQAPASGPPTLVVRLHTPVPPPEPEVEATIREAIPAYLPLRIEFVSAG